jgi:DNA-binding transcriptional LysR family regulator
MEIYRLRTFVAVARHGHLTHAAETLHLSQPTVSGQLKMLERELGVTLFRRTARGVTLTVGGEKLLSLATTILEMLDNFAVNARAGSIRVRGKLRVGTIVNPEFLRLGKITALMRAHQPDIELELQHSLSGVITQAILNKQLDAGFFLGSINRSTIQAIKLQSVGFCVIAPSSWRKQIDGASWHALAKLPWVCTPKAGAYHQLSNRLFKRHNIRPTTVIEADREPTIVNLVASGVGLSLIRADAVPVDTQRALGIFRLPGTITTDLSFLFSTGRLNDPAVGSLVEAVKAAWARV